MSLLFIIRDSQASSQPSFFFHPIVTNIVRRKSVFEVVVRYLQGLTQPPFLFFTSSQQHWHLFVSLFIYYLFSPRFFIFFRSESPRICNQPYSFFDYPLSYSFPSCHQAVSCSVSWCTVTRFFGDDTLHWISLLKVMNARFISILLSCSSLKVASPSCNIPPHIFTDLQLPLTPLCTTRKSNTLNTVVGGWSSLYY